MTALAFALRNLAGLQSRTLATIGGIMFSIASFVALVGLAQGVAANLLDSLDTRATDVVITETGALDLMSSILPDDLALEVAARPDVAAATPELARMTSLPDGRSVLVLGWQMDAFPWQGLDLIEGRLIGQDDAENVVVGEGLADRLGVGVGATIVLFQTEFRVVGIVDASSFLSRNLAYVPLASMQSLTFRDGIATSILLQLRSGDAPADERDDMIAGLRADFSGYSVEPSENLAQRYSFGRIAAVLSLSISVVAVLTAVLVIFNTMSMSVQQRRGEFALMAAVGWARWRIVAVTLGEGIALSVLAGAMGCCLGVALAYGVAQSPSVDGFIEPKITPGLVFLALVLSCFIGMFGALFPALSATARPPATVLREQ